MCLQGLRSFEHFFKSTQMPPKLVTFPKISSGNNLVTCYCIQNVKTLPFEGICKAK